jgi:hypothetical protein
MGQDETLNQITSDPSVAVKKVAGGCCGYTYKSLL